MDANIKNLQDAMEWLDRSIREEAELDGEMSNSHAIQLGFIQNMLSKFPRRNCDVGTAEEQAQGFDDFCRNTCDGCRCDHRLFQEEDKIKCAFEWAQMPYEEGGEKCPEAINR